MKHIPYTYIIFAIISFVVSGILWSANCIYLLGLIGFSAKPTIGWVFIAVINLLHFMKGLLYPDGVTPNSDLNTLDLSDLRIKILGFVTIGTSIYATKALSEYKHDKEHDV